LFFWPFPLWGTSMGLTKNLLSTLGAYWGPVGFLVTQGYRFFAYGEIGDEIKGKRHSNPSFGGAAAVANSRACETRDRMEKLAVAGGGLWRSAVNWWSGIWRAGRPSGSLP
jgi:hypothetical protein